MPHTAVDLFFLGLGWSWVGEFVGFIIAFYKKLKNVSCEYDRANG